MLMNYAFSVLMLICQKHQKKPCELSGQNFEIPMCNNASKNISPKHRISVIYSREEYFQGPSIVSCTSDIVNNLGSIPTFETLSLQQHFDSTCYCICFCLKFTNRNSIIAHQQQSKRICSSMSFLHGTLQHSYCV